MGEPTAPQLPANVPQDLRDFFECRSTSATFTNGPQQWHKDGPSIAILPGKTPASAKLDTPFGQFDAKITGGQLTVDWGKFAMADGFAGVDIGAITKQIDEINAWFRKNGYKWGPPTFDGDKVTLTKLAFKPAGQAVPPPVVATPPPAPKPKPATPTLTKHPADSTTSPSIAPKEDYLETKVPKPELPKGELFPPGSGPLVDFQSGQSPLPKSAAPASTGGAGAAPSAVGGPVVGAGGPGGPKAPRGLSKVAVVGIVGVIIAGIVAVTLFGGRPSGGETANGATPTASAQAVITRFEPSPPVSCDLADLILALGASPEVIKRLCEEALPDGTKDRIEYDGTPVDLGITVGDLINVRYLPVQVGPEFASKAAAGCAARATVFCAETPPAAGTYAMFGLGMTQAVDQAAAAFYEAAVALNDGTPGGGVGTTTWQSSIGDPLNAMNLAYSYRVPSLGSGAAIAGPFRLAYDKASSDPIFLQSSSSSFAIVDGMWVALFVPMSELDGVVGWRAFTFSQVDVGVPSGVDLAPEPGQDLFALADKLGPIDLK